MAKGRSLAVSPWGLRAHGIPGDGGAPRGDPINLRECRAAARQYRGQGYRPTEAGPGGAGVVLPASGSSCAAARAHLRIPEAGIRFSVASCRIERVVVMGSQLRRVRSRAG